MGRFVCRAPGLSLNALAFIGEVLAAWFGVALIVLSVISFRRDASAALELMAAGMVMLLGVAWLVS